MIGVDWGTTSLRAYRLSEAGVVVEARESRHGILSLPEGGFAAALEAQLAGWPQEPILVCGMAGSRQGWVETPYIECPAGLEDISARVIQVEWKGAPLRLVPGLSCRGETGVPDVMRGEETQILGVLDELERDSVVCLPGTHSKIARVRDGRVVSFRTSFTGELFAVLKAHSLLGRMIDDGPPDDAAFAEGVDRAADDGGLLHHLFGVRTRGLFGELDGARAGAYLSGLLIGHELLAAPETRKLYLIGAPELTRLYAAAASRLGIESRALDPLAAPRGLYRVSRKIGA